MRIVVPVKQVPDLVEEIELTADETDIDREFLKFVVNEFDDQALEEALLVKEAVGGEVVVVGIADDPDIDQTMYAALAKGADRAVKLSGVGGGADTHTRGAAIADWLGGEPFDLVLTGVQAADDLDGQLPSLLGGLLDLPHISVVVALEAKDGTVRVTQEFSGGTAAAFEIRPPAVLGIQAAQRSPRYAPITRIRQAMQAGSIEEVAISAVPAGPGFTVRRMFKPEAAGHAEMLTGTPDEVAGRIAELIRARGLVNG